ncbi:MAG TPA: serine hydrolase domain-containing protein [Actinopolymorphaceae bacterium]
MGSITKLWTSTLILQLVDEGRIDLDAPVRTYLPKLRVADEETSEVVTPRHLLTHTGGFEGDIFEPTTDGDDAVERFVADLLPQAQQTVPVGDVFSYNNAGFVVLGRIVEVLCGKPWAQVLRERLVEPLGLGRVATCADEAILFRAATGHLRTRSVRPLEPARTWALSRSNAPAGAMLAMSARDLLGFARAFGLPGAEAFAPQVQVPLRALADGRGLGWMLFDRPGGRVVGHDGGRIGQSAVLRVVPDAGVAVAILTTGGGGGPLFHTLLGELLAETAGANETERPSPPSPARPLENAGHDVEAGTDGDLWVTTTSRGALADSLGGEPERRRFVRLDDDTIVAATPVDGSYATYAFVGEDAQGRARYLHSGRAIPRVTTDGQ